MNKFLLLLSVLSSLITAALIGALFLLSLDPWTPIEPKASIIAAIIACAIGSFLLFQESRKKPEMVVTQEEIDQIILCVFPPEEEMVGQ